MRKYGKTDGNHGEIVKALRAIGCTVQSLASIGQGVPDLLVSRNGVLRLLEVKDGSKPPSAQRLTPEEEIWIQNWNGHVFVVHDVREALAAVGADLM